MSPTLTYSTRVHKYPTSTERLTELAARRVYLEGALTMSQAELIASNSDYEKLNLELQVKYDMILRLGYDFNAGITNSFPGEERIASDEEMAGMARVVKDLALSRKGHLETYFVTTHQNKDIRWELMLMRRSLRNMLELSRKRLPELFAKLRGRKVCHLRAQRVHRSLYLLPRRKSGEQGESQTVRMGELPGR